MQQSSRSHRTKHGDVLGVKRRRTSQTSTFKGRLLILCCSGRCRNDLFLPPRFSFFDFSSSQLPLINVSGGSLGLNLLSYRIENSVFEKVPLTGS